MDASLIIIWAFGISRYALEEKLDGTQYHIIFFLPWWNALERLLAQKIRKIRTARINVLSSSIEDARKVSKLKTRQIRPNRPTVTSCYYASSFVNAFTLIECTEENVGPENLKNSNCTPGGGRARARLLSVDSWLGDKNNLLRQCVQVSRVRETERDESCNKTPENSSVTFNFLGETYLASRVSTDFLILNNFIKLVIVILLTVVVISHFW